MILVVVFTCKDITQKCSHFSNMVRKTLCASVLNDFGELVRNTKCWYSSQHSKKQWVSTKETHFLNCGIESAKAIDLSIIMYLGSPNVTTGGMVYLYPAYPPPPPTTTFPFITTSWITVASQNHSQSQITNRSLLKHYYYYYYCRSFVVGIFMVSNFCYS